MSSVPGCYKCGAVQWLRGSRHKIQLLLWPHPQTPQVLREPLAAPGHDHLWTHPALRAAAPGGWVEVGARLNSQDKLLRIKMIQAVSENYYFFVCLIRYDLRIRYIPSNFKEKFQDDRTTMLYFYLQVSCILRRRNYRIPDKPSSFCPAYSRVVSYKCLKQALLAILCGFADLLKDVHVCTDP